ncbi:MAG: tetratricopeptide repeat protein [Candidatus Aminicenantaceae bacterium]
MKKNIILIGLFMFLVISPHFLAAQEGRGQARLSGVVVDSDGDPLEGVTVELESLIHNLSMTTETDENGNWSFLGLGKTVVKITATKAGYAPTVISDLQVSAIRNPDQEIVLSRITDIEQLEEEDPKTIYQRGVDLYDQGEYKKALSVFKEFIEKQPDLYEARINVGNIYIQLKQYDKAMKEFEFVLEKLKEEHADLEGNKTAASLYASLGELYMDQGELDQAKEYFEKSINIDPSSHALAYNVGEILFNSNEIDEAIHYYKIATEINPDWPKSYLKLGYCYLNKGEIQTAVIHLNEFVELSPPDDPQVSAVKDLIRQLERK